MVSLCIRAPRSSYNSLSEKQIYKSIQGQKQIYIFSSESEKRKLPLLHKPPMELPVALMQALKISPTFYNASLTCLVCSAATADNFRDPPAFIVMALSRCKLKCLGWNYPVSLDIAENSFSNVSASFRNDSTYDPITFLFLSIKTPAT